MLDGQSTVHHQNNLFALCAMLMLLAPKHIKGIKLWQTKNILLH